MLEEPSSEKRKSIHFLNWRAGSRLQRCSQSLSVGRRRGVGVRKATAAEGIWVVSSRLDAARHTVSLLSFIRLACRLKEPS